MNWTRGFFRIWLVISVLWATSWLVAAIGGWRELRNTATFDVTDPNGNKFRVVAPEYYSRDSVISFVETSAEARKRAEACKKDNGPWCNYPESLVIPNERDHPWVYL